MSGRRIALRLIVHGRVQGVFYRNWTVGKARQLGLAGWVRNRAEGTVEAVIEGDEDLVRDMIEQMRKGPPAALVDAIDEYPEALRMRADFERR